MRHNIPNFETLGCTWVHLAHPTCTPMLAKMAANTQAETVIQETGGVIAVNCLRSVGRYSKYLPQPNDTGC